MGSRLASPLEAVRRAAETGVHHKCIRGPGRGAKSEGGKECCSGNVISGAEEKHMLQRFFGSRAVGAERFVNHAFFVEGGVEVGAIVADG